MKTVASSGFKCLDSIIGGLRPGNLIGITSAEGMGKTSLAINIALKSNVKGKILYFAFEELKENIENRIICLGKQDIYEKSNIEIIDDYYFYNIDELDKKLSNENEIKLVLIDYISLMYCNKDKSESSQITYIMKKLKKIAVKKKITIIVLKSLSKEVYYRKNKRPTIRDLKDIKVGCDILLSIYRDEYYNAPYVTNGYPCGITYIPNYSMTLPQVGVELIVNKNKNTHKRETAYLFFNRNNGNYFE